MADPAGIRGTSVYSAGEAALRSMARTFAAELADSRIRVDTVSPVRSRRAPWRGR